MADNVQFTAGANSTPPNATLAATDELADGSHAGIAKLAISADGDRTFIPATAADGLLVEVSNPTAGGGLTDAQLRATPVDVDVIAALPAGTNNIGDVDIASLPNEGQQTMANSISVAIASNQTAIPTTDQKSATGTVTAVADNAASVTLLASNAARLGASIANDSSAALYIKCGGTASLTSYTVRVAQYGYWEVPFDYTGVIDGIWATDPGDGAARITEFTA